jgi:V/A-type H+-transporting ATPase subunit I
MFLVLVSMVLHIINYRRERNIEETFFSTNSLAGLIFYGTVVFLIIMVFSGHAVPAAGVFIALIVLSVLVMFFKEPLTKIVEKKKGPKIEGGIGMFFVQGFFEMFEVMLSFFSNTLSFVRIGAFAVSHAAMMSVVLMLAGAENGGSPNWVVIVLGNLFVMGIEGLIVGIQVLRLEFYELFSRYYKGDGKEFVPSLTKRKSEQG